MEERRKIAFDLKIPLTWILSSLGVIFSLFISLIWNIAHQNNKLDQLMSKVAEIQVKNDERDKKVDAMIKDAYEMRGQVNALIYRVDELDKLNELDKMREIKK